MEKAHLDDRTTEVNELLIHYRQPLILAAIRGDFAALAKQNEVVHAVPMLDDVQTLLDLAPQRREAQVAS
jgi:hypothetical protein